MFEACTKMSSTDVSPAATPSSTPITGAHASKFGTVIPSRIFVGGIAANFEILLGTLETTRIGYMTEDETPTTDAELKQYFSAFGAVKDTKIISDRAGASRGYGFVTFESQEDADRIIKKEADNLIFKDRKLNIGPAVRKQIIPRSYACLPDSTIAPGSVLFTNGVPYTYHNGMAIFQTPDGNYPIAQQHQPYTAAVMLPPNQMYMTPQYPYQQSAMPTVPSNPGYIWATAMPAASDIVYQNPQTYPGAELADATFVDGTVEGSMIPVEQPLANRIHSPVTEVTADQTSVPVIPVQSAATKNAIASYKKHYALTRRSFNSPTILVKHGSKVQRLMVSNTSPPTMYNGQILNPCNPSDTGDGSDASYIRYTHLPGHPATTK